MSATTMVGILYALGVVMAVLGVVACVLGLAFLVLAASEVLGR